MLGSLSPDVKHSKYPFRLFGLFGVFDAAYPHICVLILFRSVVMTVLRSGKNLTNSLYIIGTNSNKLVTKAQKTA